MINLVEDLLDIARSTGCSESERCRESLSRAASAQRSLVAAVLDGDFVREPEFLRSLATTLDLPWRDEADVTPIENVREKFPARLALGLGVIPESAIEGGELRLLTFDPFDHAGWQAIVQHWPGPVRLVITTRRRLLETLKTTYGVGADTFEELI